MPKRRPLSKFRSDTQMKRPAQPEEEIAPVVSFGPGARRPPSACLLIKSRHLAKVPLDWTASSHPAGRQLASLQGNDSGSVTVKELPSVRKGRRISRSFPSNQARCRWPTIARSRNYSKSSKTIRESFHVEASIARLGEQPFAPIFMGHGVSGKGIDPWLASTLEPAAYSAQPQFVEGIRRGTLRGRSEQCPPPARRDGPARGRFVDQAIQRTPPAHRVCNPARRSA